MTEPSLEILGIGNAIVDVLAPCDDDFLLAHGLNKGGMSLIDEATAEKLYEAMGQTIVVSGGSAANTIIGAAALGARAAFVGKVKHDPISGTCSRMISAPPKVDFETSPRRTGRRARAASSW